MIIKIFSNFNNFKTIAAYEWNNGDAKIISLSEIDTITNITDNIPYDDIIETYNFKEDINLLSSFIKSSKNSYISTAESIEATLCFKKEPWLFDSMQLSHVWYDTDEFILGKESIKEEIYHLIETNQIQTTC